MRKMKKEEDEKDKKEEDSNEQIRKETWESHDTRRNKSSSRDNSHLHFVHVRLCFLFL